QNGTARRLSIVTEGWNGATIQPSPSAIMPNGAMCTAPEALTVVTMHSRIIGIGSVRRGCAQRVPGLAQARAVLFRAVDRDAPVERLILGKALAEPPGDLGPHQLGAEVERMRTVLLHAELAEQRERILRHLVAVPIVDVDAVLGDLDAEIVVLDLRGELRDLGRRIGKRLAFVQRQQR